MFYFYVVVIPLLVLIIGYAILKIQSQHARSPINVLFKILWFEWAYALVIFGLELHQIIHQGWVFYTLFMFLLPITVILALVGVPHQQRC